MFETGQSDADGGQAGPASTGPAVAPGPARGPVSSAAFEAWVAQLATTCPMSAPEDGQEADPDRADGHSDSHSYEHGHEHGERLPGPAALVDLLAGLERVKAACAAAQVRATAAFVDAQAAQAAAWRQAAAEAGSFEAFRAARDAARRCEFTPVPLTPPPPGPGPPRERAGYDKAGVAAQVGLARRESPARGARLATTALTLARDLPHTLAALGAGILNERRADQIARLTSHLDPTQRAAVDAQVIGANLPRPGDPDDTGVGGWGDRRLEAEVRAAADRIDAAAAARRAATAHSQRRVTIRPIPDTMAMITAILPVAAAVAIHATLTKAATTAHATGDPRTRGQVMADTLVHRITHPTTYTAIPADSATGTSEGTSEGTSDGTSTAPADGTSTPAGAPTGARTGTGTGSHPPGPPVVGLPADVPIEIQLIITDRALLAGDDAPAFIPGYGPVPAGWARELLTADLDPASMHADDPPSPDTGSPRADGAPPGADGGPGDALGSRQARVYLRRLFTHPSSGALVAMDSTRRLFPVALRRYLIARDGTCRTPWCDAPIRHADHVTRYAVGGPTTARNGQGLCERCNHVKDLPGWHARVTHHGPTSHHDGRSHTVQLTTPTGHIHTSIAPPVLPGTGTTPPEDEQATRDQMRKDILAQTGHHTLRLVA